MASCTPHAHWACDARRAAGLVAQDSKGGESDRDLDQDRADRQNPDFVPRLFIHERPTFRDADRSGELGPLLQISQQRNGPGRIGASRDRFRSGIA